MPTNYRKMQALSFEFGGVSGLQERDMKRTMGKGRNGPHVGAILSG